MTNCAKCDSSNTVEECVDNKVYVVCKDCGYKFFARYEECEVNE